MDWMLFMWIALIVVGFVLLVKGADWFVDGAAGIAGKCRIPPLVIGLTVVAFGTSAPELAVSVTSAIRRATDISIGNVVGSNIVNILLILGLSALVKPLPVQKSSVKLDLPVLLVASALLVGLGAWGGALSWWDGLILLAVFACYMTALIRETLRAQGETPLPPAEPVHGVKGKTWFYAVLTVVGLGMVVGGGTLLVDGARYVAERFGVSERVIGLTVVAIGTSLPELVTSVVASAKGQTDIAVGNIIGSNIFNIFLVAGVSSLVYPLGFFEGNLVDSLVALAAALLLFVLALAGKFRLTRAAGGIMVACFAAYYLYLFLVPA